MKNILLVLLLANILYFMWGYLTEKESQPGVAVVKESDLGPPLDVTAARDSDAVASVGAVLGSGEPSALQAIVGRSCVTIGPFKEGADADSAQLEYSNEGMKAVLRPAQPQAAEPVDITMMSPVVDHADHEEHHGAGDAVANHLVIGPVPCHGRHHRTTQQHIAHVTDR